MPIPDDYRPFVNELGTATRNGTVVWKVSQSSVETSLAGLLVRMHAGLDEQENEEFVSFVLYDPLLPTREGELDRWWLSEGDADYEAAFQLVESARRSARNVPQKIAALREALRKKSDTP